MCSTHNALDNQNTVCDVWAVELGSWLRLPDKDKVNVGDAKVQNAQLNIEWRFPWVCGHAGFH
jgi:hypothetical protein